MVKVKVCGNTNLEDALVACEVGADYLGFVFEPKSSRVCTDTSFLPEIRSRFPEVKLVAVFGELVPNFDQMPFDFIQCFDLSSAMPVIRPQSESELDDLLPQIKPGKIIVLDAFHPAEAGGTGKVADWQLARRAVGSYDGHLMLAGGLAGDNVQEAIHQVQPFAVDASSRLEQSPGRKDHQKVIDFVRAAKNC